MYMIQGSITIDNMDTIYGITEEEREDEGPSSIPEECDNIMCT